MLHRSPDRLLQLLCPENTSSTHIHSHTNTLFHTNTRHREAKSRRDGNGSTAAAAVAAVVAAAVLAVMDSPLVIATIKNERENERGRRS